LEESLCNISAGESHYGMRVGIVVEILQSRHEEHDKQGKCSQEQILNEYLEMLNPLLISAEAGFGNNSHVESSLVYRNTQDANANTNVVNVRKAATTAA
jgi:hypothetical protein